MPRVLLYSRFRGGGRKAEQPGRLLLLRETLGCASNEGTTSRDPEIAGLYFPSPASATPSGTSRRLRVQPRTVSSSTYSAGIRNRLPIVAVIIPPTMARASGT